MNEIETLERHSKPVLARQAGGHFAKGVSGNPGGKSSELERFRRMCRHRKQAALATLDQAMAMVEVEPMVAVSAARAVLEFGFGKAPQELKLSGDGDALKLDVTVTVEYLEQRLARIVELRKALEEAK